MLIRDILCFLISHSLIPRSWVLDTVSSFNESDGTYQYFKSLEDWHLVLGYFSWIYTDYLTDSQTESVSFKSNSRYIASNCEIST